MTSEASGHARFMGAELAGFSTDDIGTVICPWAHGGQYPPESSFGVQIGEIAISVPR